MNKQIFSHNSYKMKGKFFEFFGRSFTIMDGSENPLLYAKTKILTLREELNITSDQERQNPVLKIKAREIIDISANYDVFDAVTNQKSALYRETD